MTKPHTEALRLKLVKAVNEAIANMGVEEFKRTSFFLSNEVAELKKREAA